MTKNVPSNCKCVISHLKFLRKRFSGFTPDRASGQSRWDGNWVKRSTGRWRTHTYSYTTNFSWGGLKFNCNIFRSFLMKCEMHFCIFIARTDEQLSCATSNIEVATDRRYMESVASDRHWQPKKHLRMYSISPNFSTLPLSRGPVKKPRVLYISTFDKLTFSNVASRVTNHAWSRCHAVIAEASWHRSHEPMTVYFPRGEANRYVVPVRCQRVIMNHDFWQRVLPE